jgi:heat-inducible transcriptional repressor
MGQKVRDTEAALAAHQQNLASRARTLVETFPQLPVGRLLLEGTNQLFEQPEFRDIGKARGVLSALEERDQLAALLRARLRDGLDGGLVLIGSDKDGESLSGLSVVAQPYYVKEKPAGMVGVLGPRRMPYSKAMGLVRYTADLVSRMLTRLAG